MRRGWHEDWDATERIVWTAIALSWACFLAWWLFCYILMRLGVGPSDLNGLAPQWAWETLIGVHLLTYALMWLRRMFQATRQP